MLAITRKPHSASFEQRIWNHIELLRYQGIDVTVRVYPKAIREQAAVLVESKGYDLVWWHRHLLPLWRLHQLRKSAKRIVFDFDDPVGFSTRTHGRSFMRSRRFAALLRACDAAMVGSCYLEKLALSYCANVYRIPMAISLPDVRSKPDLQKKGIELLWLGSKSTQKYLEALRPALERIGELRPDIGMRLVAHKPMSFGALKTVFVQWSPEAQEQALQECDIGLCPMPDTPWTRGKCPYKVLQYMANGMPWVGSAVGENIITAGVAGSSDQRGVCATGADEWVQAVVVLADNSQRPHLGANCREYIAQHHEREKVAEQIAATLRGIKS
ncbi:MAG: glycosyltransferase [Candidatus Polarisedimenticolaceae bacterium]|nr:glycosyltransferase [Candidatus Polarisedimenticolaceae bacterium]